MMIQQNVLHPLFEKKITDDTSILIPVFVITFAAIDEKRTRSKSQLMEPPATIPSVKQSLPLSATATLLPIPNHESIPQQRGVDSKECTNP